MKFVPIPSVIAIEVERAVTVDEWLLGMPPVSRKFF